MKYELLLKGELNEDLISKLHSILEEPDWLLEYRLKGLEYFRKLRNPDWGPDLSEIDFKKITYFASPLYAPKPVKWEELPEFIREVYIKLGLTKEYVEKYLGGTVFQFDSSPVFRKVREYLESLGVIFMPLSEAVKEYPDLIKKYFSRVVSYSDNRFAALNTAVWSGGIFIYVPKNVKVDIPLHAYFRINLEDMGQFERTLIIAEENSEVTYVEGCSAPILSASPLHAAVVEVYVHKNAKVNYITLQNWSRNVYNLPTKRAFVEENGRINWVSVELGGKVSMLYPSAILKDNAVAEIYGISVAKKDQVFDSGGRLYLNGKNARGIINSIGIAMDESSRVTHRIDVFINKGSKNSRVLSSCKTLLINGETESIPRFYVNEEDSYYNNESRMDLLDEERLFYLESKGIDRNKALKMAVLGYFEDLLEKIPDIYKLEIKRIIEIDVEKHGAVG